MGNRIIVTGMFGCGSSAVWDLLCEYPCNKSGLPDERSYEQNVFYTPNGLFDLADKLLIGNDLHRSDEALISFYKEMKKLNENDFGWFGSYQALFGDRFMKSVNMFFNELPVYKVPGRYYGQYKGVSFSAIKMLLQFAAKVLQHRTIYKWGRRYKYTDRRQELCLTFPEEKEFYQAAKKFVNTYMELFGSVKSNNILYDRLLLPHNLWRLPQYFGEDVRVINVERDIRDLYILNKYIWPRLHAGTMYPQNIDEFISFWRHCKKNERKITDTRIMNIQFEDLVYRYEDSVQKIQKFCGLSSGQHKDIKKYFNPEKSIVNTQTFLAEDAWKPEVMAIEKYLPEYLYYYGDAHKPDIKKMFDDSRI